MTDRDTLINTLMLCLGEGNENPDPCNYCAYSAKGACVRELMRDALALLKETEPVKPRTEDAWPTPIKICGSCGAFLFCVCDYKPKFCAECGRAVKWGA